MQGGPRDREGKVAKDQRTQESVGKGRMEWGLGPQGSELYSTTTGTLSERAGEETLNRQVLLIS